MRHVPVEGAGLAVDWTPDEVTEEMLHSLDHALDVLANDGQANLLRTFQNGSDPIYELVHDGVAPALNRWADDLLGRPQAMLGGICSRRGIVFSQDIVAGMFTTGERVDPRWGAARAVADDDGPRIELSALRWHGLGIHRKTLEEDHEQPVRIEGIVFRECDFVGTLLRHARITDVRFVDCDLQGVAVLGCTLENVTFENCVLTGAAFNGCTLDGVRFDGDRPDVNCDNLAIRDARAGARVRFRNWTAVGLFISDVAGGAWSFHDVAVRHFLLTASDDDPLTVEIDGTSRLRPVTIDAPADATAFTIGPDVDCDREAFAAPPSAAPGSASPAGAASE